MLHTEFYDRHLLPPRFSSLRIIDTESPTNRITMKSLKPHPLPPFNEPQPEQAFLAKHYDENAKRGDRDARTAARLPSEVPGQLATGVVGPMGGGFLPNVERALSEMEGSLLPGGDRKAARRVRLPCLRSFLLVCIF